MLFTFYVLYLRHNGIYACARHRYEPICSPETKHTGNDSAFNLTEYVLYKER